MSSEYDTSGLRLSGRYTSARNVVISMTMLPLRQPTVPKRWPCSQIASAHGRTSRSTTSGRASVVTSTSGFSSSRTVRSRNASRTLPPTRKHSWPASVSRRARSCSGDESSSSDCRRGGNADIATILVGSGASTRTTDSDPERHPEGRHPENRRHAPLPSPTWTVHPTALAWAATSPRWPSSRSTHASASCGSTPSARVDAAPGCSATRTPTACHRRGVEPARPARRRVAPVDGPGHRTRADPPHADDARRRPEGASTRHVRAPLSAARPTAPVRRAGRPRAGTRPRA